MLLYGHRVHRWFLKSFSIEIYSIVGKFPTVYENLEELYERIVNARNMLSTQEMMQILSQGFEFVFFLCLRFQLFFLNMKKV